MQGCVDPNGLNVTGCPAVPVVPCPDPPIPPGRPTGYVEFCRDDGTPVILVIDRGDADNVPCPPTGPLDPTISGWIDPVSGAFTAGAPGFALGPCGSRSDVEVAGRICVVDSVTGDYVGSVFIEGIWDNTTDPPTFVSYQYAFFPADGSAPVRPYTLGANERFEPCPTGSDEPILMHDCVDGVGCFQFIRWYNSVTKQPIGDRGPLGTVYVPVGTIDFGPCPGGAFTSELVYDVIPAAVGGVSTTTISSPVVRVPTASEVTALAAAFPTTVVAPISSPTLSATQYVGLPPLAGGASVFGYVSPGLSLVCADTVDVVATVAITLTPYGTALPATGGIDGALRLESPAQTVLSTFVIPSGAPTGGVSSTATYTVSATGLTAAQANSLELLVGVQNYDSASMGGMDWSATVSFDVTVDSTSCATPAQCIPVEIVKTVLCNNDLSVSYYTLDGVPYVPVGTVGVECCLSSGSFYEGGVLGVVDGVPSTHTFASPVNEITVHNTTCCAINVSVPGVGNMVIAPGSAAPFVLGCSTATDVIVTANGCNGDVIVNGSFVTTNKG